jgi:hypothetical protein
MTERKSLGSQDAQLGKRPKTAAVPLAAMSIVDGVAAGMAGHKLGLHPPATIIQSQPQQ